jgi:alpha-glucosidase
VAGPEASSAGSVHRRWQWWRSGVLYQIYPRSFADSNADGVGDLEGVIAHLDHLAWLGVDGIWLSPITVSPNADWGYDVADYCDVDPAYGTIRDLDRLVAEAARVGIRVLLDLVPNHTSSRHPWFQAALADRNSPYRDYYVWHDPRPDGAPPNNWVSSFGGPAWTFDEASGQWYLHNFLPEQPDLNWWNEAVRDEFDKILRFWFDRGVAGFRIDVCHMIVKDAQLRDNPPADESDPFLTQVFGQKTVFNACRPEVHDVLRRWRQIAEEYDPPRLLLGETNVDRLEDIIPFYGSGDELNLAFNFQFVTAAFEPAALSGIVDRMAELLPDGEWPVWTGSNHDESHLATRWAVGDAAKVELALMMLLTLRGTPVLYQGDEIGLDDTSIERDEVRDPVGLRFWPFYKGRDPERNPMPWRPGAGGGFTEPGVTTWVRMGDPDLSNVSDQRADPGSVLNFVSDLIALRRATPDLQVGDSTRIPAPDGCWAWRRGDSATVVLNMSDDPVRVVGVEGRIAACTDRSREGEVAGGTLELTGWTGAVTVTVTG